MNHKENEMERSELESYIDENYNGVYASPITDPKEKAKADRLTREYIKLSKERNNK